MHEPPLFVRAISKNRNWGLPVSAVLAAAFGPAQSECPSINKRTPPGRLPARRRRCAPVKCPQLNLTLQMVTRPPNSYRVFDNPRYLEDGPDRTQLPLSINANTKDPVSHGRVFAPQHGDECRQRNTPRAFYVKSNCPQLLMGTGPHPVGKGQSGLSDPMDVGFNRDLPKNPTLP